MPDVLSEGLVSFIGEQRVDFSTSAC